MDTLLNVFSREILVSRMVPELHDATKAKIIAVSGIALTLLLDPAEFVTF